MLYRLSFCFIHGGRCGTKMQSAMIYCLWLMVGQKTGLLRSLWVMLAAHSQMLGIF